jgi:hypothetical protein
MQVEREQQHKEVREQVQYQTRYILPSLSMVKYDIGYFLMQ